MDRAGLSMRVRTNTEKQTVWQRWHKLQNYHHYIKVIRTEPISDTETETSSDVTETSSDESESSSETSS